MKILGIDTSLHSCSAALLANEKIHELYELVPQQQTKYILSMIDGLLFANHTSLSQLDALAFSQGPGNFTGVRIGAAVIQGLALANNLPVIPISTMQLIAQVAFQEYGIEHCYVCIDAHMKQLYYAEYRIDDNKIMQPIIFDKIISNDELSKPPVSIKAVGNGWNFLNVDDLEIYLIEPRASALIPLAKYYLQQNKTVAGKDALPVYLHDGNIWKKVNGT